MKIFNKIKISISYNIENIVSETAKMLLVWWTVVQLSWWINTLTQDSNNKYLKFADWYRPKIPVVNNDRKTSVSRGMCYATLDNNWYAFIFVNTTTYPRWMLIWILNG